MALGKVQLPLWEKTSSPMLEPVVISKSPRETLSLSKTQQVSSCHSKGTGRWHQAGAPHMVLLQGRRHPGEGWAAQSGHHGIATVGQQAQGVTHKAHPKAGRALQPSSLPLQALALQCGCWSGQ